MKIRTRFTIVLMFVDHWKLMSFKKMQKYFRQSHAKEKKRKKPVSLERSYHSDREQRLKFVGASSSLLLSILPWVGRTESL